MAIEDRTHPADRLDEVEAAAWGEDIPVDGSLVPGSDAAGMDAGVMKFEDWRENWGGLYWAAGEMRQSAETWMSGGVWA